MSSPINAGSNSLFFSPTGVHSYECAEPVLSRLSPPENLTAQDIENQNTSLTDMVSNISKGYKLFLEQIKEISDAFRNCLKILEFFILNQENIKFIILKFDIDINKLENIFSSLNNVFKWANTLAPLLFAAIENLIVQRHYFAQLRDCEAQYQKINHASLGSSTPSHRTNNDTSQKVSFTMARFRREIQENLKRATQTLVVKSFKLCELLAPMILSLAGVTQKVTYIFVKYICEGGRYLYVCSQITQDLRLQKKWIQILKKLENEHLETNNKALTQTLIGALKRKNEIERKFLIFKLIQHVAAFCLSSIELAFKLCGEYLHKRYLISRIGIPDLSHYFPWTNIFYLAYLIYEKISLKFERIVSLVVEYPFARFYKPHEYSLKGYRIYTQTQLLNIFFELKKYLYFVIKTLLWPLSKTKGHSFFTDVQSILQKSQWNDQYTIDSLNKEYRDLEIKDAEHLFQDENQLDLTFESIADQIFALVKSHSLNGKVKRFFINHIGFDPSGKTKRHIQSQLESLFIKHGEKFTRSFYDLCANG